ncbi:MAG: deoxyribonuclease IV [Thermodesulfovibrionales bacterium]
MKNLSGGARRLGVHTSIAGGLHMSLVRARGLGCTTLQIFSHNPRGWALKPLSDDDAGLFRKTRAEAGIGPVFVHTSYLINLASQAPDLLRKSEEMVAEELRIAERIGAEYVVLHTGSASGDDPAAARRRAVGCLARIAAQGPFGARLLLENTAGERGDITSTISDLAEIVHAVPPGLIGGICLDTCHAFSAGYDVRTEAGLDSLAQEIRATIGPDAVQLLHLNDARHGFRAGRDRHEHIGKGMIGAEGIRRVVHHPFFHDVPLVLETPKKTDEDDRMNLTLVRSLLAGS